MINRRDFLKGIGVGGGAATLGVNAGLSKTDSQDQNQKSIQSDPKCDLDGRDRNVLRQLENALEDDVGEINENLRSAEQQRGETVYTIGVESDSIDEDLYAVAFGNEDNTFVNENEEFYRDIARSVAEVGRQLVRRDNLPRDDQLSVYAGASGRNNSYMPLKMVFRPDRGFRVDNKSDLDYGRFEDQTGDTMEELLPFQRQALRQLGGFDDVYEDDKLVTVMENLDGAPRNDWDDDGEFLLDDDLAELIATEDNSGGEKAARVRFYEDDDWQYEDRFEGDKLDTGDYRLRIDHIDPEAGYMEAEVIDGNYNRIDNTPFVQVDEPFRPSR